MRKIYVFENDRRRLSITFGRFNYGIDKIGKDWSAWSAGVGFACLVYVRKLNIGGRDERRD